MLRGGIDTWVERLINKVAAKNCCRAKEHESLGAATAGQ
jgi:hypothetical protein